MERLTFKDKNGIYIILENKEQEKYYFNNNYVMLNFYYSKKIIEKLAEFEDFIEEVGLNTITELKEILTTSELWEENQKLKDRWNMLKAWITNQKQLMGNNLCFMKETLLQKIEEFEKDM